MKKLFAKTLEALARDEDVVLTTIISGTGSTPRGVGARMLICSGGSSYGTIGGGNVEYEASKRAKKALEQRESAVKGYDLAPSQVADLGMVCGGAVVVYFQYISYKNEEFKELCERIIRQGDKDEDAWLIMDMTDNKAWSMGMYSKSQGIVGIDVPELEPLLRRKAIRIVGKSHTFYAEPYVKAGKVYIFGGGHVAQELVPVLSHLDFKCVILDDRIEFTKEKLFPAAEGTILCNFEAIDEHIQITKNDYIVIMTRGHQYDYEVQLQVLNKKPRYIGVMGSSRKIQFVTNKLLKDGFTKEEIDVCHMPIGTYIRAETPAEIAISIAGELIQERSIRGKDEKNETNRN